MMAEANAGARLRRGVDVDLIEVGYSLRGRRIRLPRQDPRYSELELPELVVVGRRTTESRDGPQAH
jgi:hypothetical protein